MSTDLELALEHHGIKGMKWGVRNDPGQGGRQALDKVGSAAKSAASSAASAGKKAGSAIAKGGKTVGSTAASAGKTVGRTVSNAGKTIADKYDSASNKSSVVNRYLGQAVVIPNGSSVTVIRAGGLSRSMQNKAYRDAGAASASAKKAYKQTSIRDREGRKAAKKAYTDTFGNEYAKSFNKQSSQYFKDDRWMPSMSYNSKNGRTSVSYKKKERGK